MVFTVISSGTDGPRWLKCCEREQEQRQEAGALIARPAAMSSFPVPYRHFIRDRKKGRKKNRRGVVDSCCVRAFSFLCCMCGPRDRELDCFPSTYLHALSPGCQGLSCIRLLVPDVTSSSRWWLYGKVRGKCLPFRVDGQCRNSQTHNLPLLGLALHPLAFYALHCTATYNQSVRSLLASKHLDTAHHCLIRAHRARPISSVRLTGAASR